MHNFGEKKKRCTFIGITLKQWSNVYQCKSKRKEEDLPKNVIKDSKSGATHEKLERTQIHIHNLYFIIRIVIGTVDIRQRGRIRVVFGDEFVIPQDYW